MRWGRLRKAEPSPHLPERKVNRNQTANLFLTLGPSTGSCSTFHSWSAVRMRGPPNNRSFMMARRVTDARRREDLRSHLSPLAIYESCWWGLTLTLDPGWQPRDDGRAAKDLMLGESGVPQQLSWRTSEVPANAEGINFLFPFLI